MLCDIKERLNFHKKDVFTDQYVALYIFNITFFLIFLKRELTLIN